MSKDPDRLQQIIGSIRNADDARWLAFYAAEHAEAEQALRFFHEGVDGVLRNLKTPTGSSWEALPAPNPAKAYFENAAYRAQCEAAGVAAEPAPKPKKPPKAPKARRKAK
jgi:hypothetical protein